MKAREFAAHMQELLEKNLSSVALCCGNSLKEDIHRTPTRIRMRITFFCCIRKD